MAQLVKYLTFDFGSGHDLVVCESEPHIGLCTDGAEYLWVLSLSLSALPCLCSLSFFQSK